MTVLCVWVLVMVAQWLAASVQEAGIGCLCSNCSVLVCSRLCSVRSVFCWFVLRVVVQGDLRLISVCCLQLSSTACQCSWCIDSAGSAWMPFCGAAHAALGSFLSLTVECVLLRCKRDHPAFVWQWNSRFQAGSLLCCSRNEGCSTRQVW